MFRNEKKKKINIRGSFISLSMRKLFVEIVNR